MIADLHSDHFIMISKVHATHSHRNTACRTHILLTKPDTHTVFCNQDHILFIICNLHFDQFIIFSENDRSQSGLSDICIIFNRSLFHKTFFCCHQQILSILVLPDWNHCCDLLIRHQLQQIDDCSTARSSACFRNLIAFQTVHTSCICKEHDIVMCCRNKQFLDIVIIQDLHSFDSFSASVLTLECIHGHSLNVSHFCHGDHHIFSWDQIFHGNIKLIKSDGCSSLISIFFGNDKNLLFDHTKKQFSVRKNRF